MRVSITLLICTVPLVLSSCSRLDQPPLEEVVSQTLVAGSESPPNPPSPPQAPGEPEIDEPLIDETAIDETAKDTEQLAVQRGAQDREPDPNVVERKSSGSSRKKGEINFDDLKFEMEKDSPFEDEMLTAELLELDGKNVKLRGYILPATLYSETNISQFVLVRDNQECCFGPGAALYDCVMIEMVDGATTDFVTRPVTVEGTFVVDTEKYRWPEGYSPTKATHMAVFRIDGKKVK